jgi:hypothetical protein
MLLKAWLVMVLSPTGPYPILECHGEAGSAKSTTARVLRGLVDPAKAPVRGMPRDTRDLVIAAQNGWIVALDNLSGLPLWLSDTLCRLATGEGFATRQLFENDPEVIFETMRPVILTGVVDLATQSDLLNRTLSLTLQWINPKQRRRERIFWRDFEVAQPRLLGALLDAASCALRRESTLELPEYSRMADFVHWAAAAAPALGYTQELFLAEYTGATVAIHDQALESSLIGQPLLSLVGQNTWTGTATDLLAALEIKAQAKTDDAAKTLDDGKAGRKHPSISLICFDDSLPTCGRSGMTSALYMRRSDG